MAIQKTILWYDLETYGLSPRVDRIAQAAMIRTNLSLEIIDEPILLYGKLSPDYLPSPESCMITGLTPLDINGREDSLSEYELIKRINDEFLVPGTVGVGYNSMNFDDECIRSTLYRNLFDPYERENFKMRSRWDIINLVRATRDLRPEGMVFEKRNDETGFVSFRLTDLTEENNIEQVGAHDALVDVYATINVARMIKEKQPNLFSWAFTNRTKVDIWRLLDVERHTPMLHTSALYASENGNTHPIIPLWRNREKSNDIWCFDLTKEIPDSLEEVEDMKEAGFVRVMTNKCPFIAPLSVLNHKVEERLGFRKKDIEEKAKALVRDKRFLFDLSPLFTNTTYQDEEKDPDFTIYERFLSQSDKERLNKIRELPPERKLKDGDYNFDDPKYYKLLWRMVGRNWPDVFDEEEKQKWKNFCASRLINPPSKYQRTMELYMRECDEILESIERTPQEKIIAKKLKDYGLLLSREVLD